MHSHDVSVTLVNLQYFVQGRDLKLSKIMTISSPDFDPILIHSDLQSMYIIKGLG